MASNSAAPRLTWRDELETIEQRSLWADAFDRFRENRLAVFSLIFIIFMLLASIFGPMLSPYHFARQDLLIVNQPPTREHWFGTDGLGRDYLTRIMMGGRTAFLVATITVVVSTLLGVFLGAVSAYFGGWVDNVLMRVTDALLSFPQLLLAMFIVGMVREPARIFVEPYDWLRGSAVVDFVVVFGALALLSWPGIARLVRGQVLSLMEKEFIEAERAMGVPGMTIVKDHLMPNALGPVIVGVPAAFGAALTLESSLSFLGVGIRPPGASWGNMISENLVTWVYLPHLLAIPAVILALAVLAFNFLGDGINDALNPRLAQRR